jgi:deoxyribonuclease IV
VRDIGLHLQINGSLEDLVAQADRFDVQTFQCFFASRNSGKLLSFTSNDIERFAALRPDCFGNLYVHSSYWVNLADATRRYHPLLEQELALAERLEFTHMVLHAGSSAGPRKKGAAFDALARSLDRLLNNKVGLTVLLENTAHGGKAVGSDIDDMCTILKLLGDPEKLHFCIDVAHAHLFGYKLVDPDDQDDFIRMIDEKLGWDRVALIHLNDTNETCGSKIDCHAGVGNGKIGNDALRRFILHPALASIPVILEIPLLPEQEQKELLEKVRGWHGVP